LSVAIGSNLDPQFLPIGPNDLKQRLRAAQTELGFYMLIRRGHRQKLDDVSINTLRSLVQAKPKDRRYIGPLCFALGLSDKQQYQQEYEDRMRTAKWDGSYWLPLVLEGKSEMAYGLMRQVVNGKWVEADPAAAKHGFALIRKAVDIAPNAAPAHFELCNAYISLQNKWNPDTQKYESIPDYYTLAKSEITITLRLDPDMYDAVRTKLWIDLFDFKDNDGALRDKQKILTEIPGEDVLNSGEKYLLSLVKD